MTAPLCDQPPRTVGAVSQIMARYDAAIVDVWGVIHNGVSLYPGAVEACQRFRAERGPLVLVSNAPRPHTDVRVQLRALGVPDDAFDAVITSGDATRAELSARAPGPVHAIGPPADAHLYEGLGLDFAGVDAAAFVCVTGLHDDNVETPVDYADALARLKARDLEMVSANPDIVVDRGGRLIYCGGALAAAYAALGGRVIEAGKPNAPIYQLAYAAIRAAAGGPIEKANILAVGDGPLTDMRGANAQGLDAVFILGGIHAQTFARVGDGAGGDDAGLAARAQTILAQDGVSAAYVMSALRP